MVLLSLEIQMAACRPKRARTYVFVQGNMHACMCRARSHMHACSGGDLSCSIGQVLGGLCWCMQCNAVYVAIAHCQGAATYTANRAESVCTPRWLNYFADAR
jgi:hypothetical protein